VSDAGYLTLNKLSKSYGAAPAVSDVSLSIPRGEFVTFLGPSGCGKTTILRMIAGLLEPSDGRILVDGCDVTAMPAHRRNMGLVFQSYALFPHMSVARNVAFGLEMRGVARAEIVARVAEALALVRLETLAERQPKQLSGGQQQRVALARALVIRPSVLLLDEPLSNLDAKLREDLRDEIRSIQRRLHITTVFVTHDQQEALTMSDRVVVMEKGSVAQAGTPAEIYEAPATPFVATFVGRMNRIAVRVAASGPDGSVLDAAGVRLRASHVLPVGRSGVAMIRPHRIRLDAVGENRLPATVRKVTFAGDTLEYELESPTARLTVEQHTRSGGVRLHEAGESVTASWDPGDTVVFPT
jgi:putative spermidine/putrescine transport system ATP-binding protein